MFEDLTLPIAAFGVVVAFIVMAIISNVMSKRSNRESGDLAAMQAEKDVMRANHAVEIAALERRLATAQTRGLEGDAALRVAEAESRAAELKGELDSLKAGAQQSEAGLKSATEERDTLAKSLATAAAERDAAVAERDKAAADAKERARTITALREELATATNRLVRPNDPPKGPSPAELAAAVAAREVAEREADELRQERDALKANAGAGAAGSAELAALRESLAAAERTIADRDKAIEALKAAGTAPGEGVSSAKVAELTAALQAVEARERTANQELSRLSYDLDQMRGRIASHERLESEAKAKVDQREALLELRQQKIYELEATVRELRESATAAAAPNDQVALLRKRLNGVRSEKDALLGELEALRQDMSAAAEAGGSADVAALRKTVDELRAENANLKAAAGEASALNAAEVASLREELRKLAQKFIDMAGSQPEEKSPEEMTLAERIRAFKAARTTG
ncbi:hypothetical protein [Acuticoccus sediminis]|uniref:hypothetical protein n=1 Tax=Acuticoccus sediminis TaxID=2184697 RepID=UPI0011B93A7E|nr:hypothetical protein [Acuticoccus sediminis]